MANEPKTTNMADIPKGLPDGITVNSTPELRITPHPFVLLEPQGDLAKDVRDVLAAHGLGDLLSEKADTCAELAHRRQPAGLREAISLIPRNDIPPFWQGGFEIILGHVSNVLKIDP